MVRAPGPDSALGVGKRCETSRSIRRFSSVPPCLCGEDVLAWHACRCFFGLREADPSGAVFPVAGTPMAMRNRQDIDRGGKLAVHYGKRKTMQHEFAGSIGTRRPPLRRGQNAVNGVIDFLHEFPGSAGRRFCGSAALTLNNDDLAPQWPSRLRRKCRGPQRRWSALPPLPPQRDGSRNSTERSFGSG